jgi:hypothetical protein
MGFTRTESLSANEVKVMERENHIFGIYCIQQYLYINLAGFQPSTPIISVFLIVFVRSPL